MPKKSMMYGEVMRSDGTGAPVRVDGKVVSRADRVGYNPENLDPLMRSLFEAAERGNKLLEHYQPLLVGLLTKLQAWVLRITQIPAEEAGKDTLLEMQMFTEVVDKIAQTIERIGKVTTGAVKAGDDAMRLRVFLTGEQESDGLDDLSEVELRKLIIAAAEGWQKEEDAE